MQQVVDRFARHNGITPVDSSHPDLHKRVQKKFKLITDLTTWEAKRPGFEREIQRFGFMYFDLENKITHGLYQLAEVRLIQCGSFHGNMVVFDLRKFCPYQWIKEALQREDIFIAGSDVVKDVAKLPIEIRPDNVTKVFELQRLRIVCQRFGVLNPRSSGIGAWAKELTGEDFHMTGTSAEYARKYGQDSLDLISFRKEERRYDVLYDWEGPMKFFQKRYLLLECHTVVGVILKMITVLGEHHPEYFQSNIITGCKLILENFQDNQFSKFGTCLDSVEMFPPMAVKTEAETESEIPVSLFGPEPPEPSPSVSMDTDDIVIPPRPVTPIPEIVDVIPNVGLASPLQPQVVSTAPAPTIVASPVPTFSMEPIPGPSQPSTSRKDLDAESACKFKAQLADFLARRKKVQTEIYKAGPANIIARLGLLQDVEETFELLKIVLESIQLTIDLPRDIREDAFRGVPDKRIVQLMEALDKFKDAGAMMDMVWKTLGRDKDEKETSGPPPKKSRKTEETETCSTASKPYAGTLSDRQRLLDGRNTYRPTLKGCYCCSSMDHKENDCPHKRDAFCKYCHRYGHLLAACHAISDVCSECRYRGHLRPRGGCKDRVLRRDYERFNRYADSNFFCQQDREEWPEYGFFFMPTQYRDNHGKKPKTYDELLSMGPANAILHIKEVCDANQSSEGSSSGKQPHGPVTLGKRRRSKN